MTENIKRVTNPLTIIAIFAALAEINSTVAIGLVEKEHQGIFLWFVILFPTLLIILFFATLNFNPKVIYAPSDFKNEQNFLDTVSGNIYLKSAYAVQVSANKANIHTATAELDKQLTAAAKDDSFADLEKLALAKINVFYSKFIDKATPLIEDKVVSSIGFGLKGFGYYALDIKFSDEKFPTEKDPGELHPILDHSLIIRSFESHGEISFEMFEYNFKVTSGDVLELVFHVYNWMLGKIPQFEEYKSRSYLK